MQRRYRKIEDLYNRSATSTDVVLDIESFSPTSESIPELPVELLFHILEYCSEEVFPAFALASWQFYFIVLEKTNNRKLLEIYSQQIGKLDHWIVANSLVTAAMPIDLIQVLTNEIPTLIKRVDSGADKKTSHLKILNSLIQIKKFNLEVEAMNIKSMPSNNAYELVLKTACLIGLSFAVEYLTEWTPSFFLGAATAMGYFASGVWKGINAEKNQIDEENKLAKKFNQTIYHFYHKDNSRGPIEQKALIHRSTL